MNRVCEFRLTALLVVLCLAAACGKSAPQSPLAPSSASAVPAASIAGATVSGQVRSGAAPVRSSGVSAGLAVTVLGTSLTTAVDNAGRFTLQGVPAGNVELQFGGAGVDARVALGQVAERERIEVEIEIHGGVGDLMTSEHVAPDDNVEVEGRISSIDSSARTLAVGSASVQVPAGASVSSGSTGLEFKDLRVQQRVHIRGTLQGTVVSAREIEIEDGVSPSPQPQPEPEPAPQPEPQPEPEVEFAGAVAAMGGSCPAIALSVAGRSVTTSAATDFQGGSCGDLRNGVTVEVKGTVASNGGVAASRVKIDR